jgi:hypothetical protein
LPEGGWSLPVFLVSLAGKLLRDSVPFLRDLHKWNGLFKERNSMQEYRSLDEVTEEYLRSHPEEVEDFIREALDDYQQDGNFAVLYNILKLVARVKGIEQ